MQVAILLVEDQWRENLLRHWRRFEDLQQLSGRHGEELGVWREAARRHRRPEVEPGIDDLLLEIDDECEAIDVNRQQDPVVWREHDPLDVASILKRECPRNIAAKEDQIRKGVFVVFIGYQLTS